MSPKPFEGVRTFNIFVDQVCHIGSEAPSNSKKVPTVGGFSLGLRLRTSTSTSTRYEYWTGTPVAPGTSTRTGTRNMPRICLRQPSTAGCNCPPPRPLAWYEQEVRV